MPSLIRHSRLVTGALAVALVAAACGGASSGGGSGSGGQLSIVSIGDSIASGEGIAYGYTYDNHQPGPHWVGGVTNPQWSGPYPQCHQTSAAFGNVVAEARKAKYLNLACTGATYTNGISAPWNFSGSAQVPAQFGDWNTKTNLNTAYDQARPDVVLVTFGADDVHFKDILLACDLGSKVDPNLCTPQDPGPTVQSDFFSQLGSLTQDYKTLATQIQARGQAAQPAKVPFIVFTSYPNPLPPPSADISLTTCPDVAGLDRAQLDYLTSLLQQQAQLVRNAVGGMKGVAVADVSGALAGHQLCSPDPWAYGASVLLLNPQSSAPAHPTAQGQNAIAQIVLKSVPSHPSG